MGFVAVGIAFQRSTGVLIKTSERGSALVDPVGGTPLRILYITGTQPAQQVAIQLIQHAVSSDTQAAAALMAVQIQQQQQAPRSQHPHM
jgi:hypothetical protein